MIGVKTLHISRVPEESEFTTGDSKRRCMSWEREDAASAENCTIVPSPFVSQSGFQKPVFSGTVVEKNPFVEGMTILDHSKQHILHESPDSTLAGSKVISSFTKDTMISSVENNSLMPVLKSQASANIDDPTMQGYYDKQYAIKKEQAFHCHHARDISEAARIQKQDVGLWDYLKSITNFGR